ncbi:MAG: carbohydrate kinase [Chloroflexota bacterium]
MILVCGEALIDLVPLSQGDEPAYVARAGGSSFNVAVGLGRLGIPVGFMGRVSRDPFGQMLRRRLLADGVDCRLVQEGDELSTLAIVHLETGAEPVYTFHDVNAADRMLRVDDLPAVLPSEVTALHFGSISMVREPGASAFEAVMRREHGSRVLSLDPNVRPSLVGDRPAYVARLEGWVSLADVVKVSRADLAWLYPETAPDAAAEAWLARGPGLVVVTRGADGSIGLTARDRVAVAGTPVVVSDTVGAGDAFTSGLLAWLHAAGRLERASIREIPADALREALTCADRAAAITCTRAGAQPPTRAEMDESDPA